MSIRLKPCFMVAVQDHEHGIWRLIGDSLPSDQIAAAATMDMLDIYEPKNRLAPVKIDSSGVHLLCDPVNGTKVPKYPTEYQSLPLPIAP